MEINAKRVQRLWRQEGLRVPRRQRKRARLGKSENGTQRLSAERVNHVWSYDFVMDQTEDGRRLKWLPICDEPFGHELRAEWFSRELVALEVERRMEARDVIRILDEAVAARLARPPTSLVPSASSADVCRSSSAATTARSSWPWPCGNGSRGGGSRRSPSSPAARGRTPTAKALSCRFRDEFLNREAFASVLEAAVIGVPDAEGLTKTKAFVVLKAGTQATDAELKANGPELVALAVQDWIARRGFATLYIKPGSPWQNAYSESFNSRFRDEFLNRELFGGLTEAKVLGKDYRRDYNTRRPHSSLGYQTPVEFAQRSLAAASATLRQPQGCALSPEHPTHNPNPEPNQKLS